MDRDGPDEPEQFAAQSRHDLVFILAADGERLVAFVEAILCFPGDLLDLIAEGQRFLPSEKEASDVGPVLVGLGGLHQDPSQMGVPVLVIAPR